MFYAPLVKRGIMKLKILKNIRLANPEPAIRPWSFKDGEIIDIEDNGYLSKRLIEIGAAKELSDVEEKAPETAKMVGPDKNKMITPEYNKSSKNSKKKKSKK